MARLSILVPIYNVERYLEQCLDQLKDRHGCIVERRGAGLMQGLVLDRPVGPVINKALEEGLILINARTDIIRFVPPLIISRRHIDEMIDILDDCID